MDGTLTGLGDFDQCLNIRYSEGYGKYCLLELSFKNRIIKASDADKIDRYLNGMLPIVDYYNPRIALCLPSKCPEAEILQLVDHRK